MFPCRLEERTRRLDPAEVDRLVAIRAKPGRGCRSGPKFGTGAKRESPTEGELVGVQSERHQQRPNGRIRFARITPQADSSGVGQRTPSRAASPAQRTPPPPRRHPP